MIRRLLISISLFSLCALLTSCGTDEHPAVDVELLATDVHVSVAQHTMVLPFVALDDYAYRKQSFSLDRKGDSERARVALNQFLRDSAGPTKPLVLDGLSVVVRTYGWNDGDMRQREVCHLLTRMWSRSVCDNPWSAIQQALPANRFRLVELRHLDVEDPHSPTNCREDAKPRRPLPTKTGEAVMVCAAMVYGGEDDEFHSAVIRIDGHLGAVWTVWRYGQEGETAAAMTEREGKAIVAFVNHALGKKENFSTLQAEMCRLRRPGSVDSPKGADCEVTALPVPSRNQ